MESGIFIIFLVSLICFLLAFLMSDKGKSDDAEDEKAEFDEFIQIECNNQNYFLSSSNVIPDVDYGYVNYSSKIRARYVVDGKQRMIYIAYNSSEFMRIPFSDIVGFDILSESDSKTYTESKSNSGVGRAIAGYVLAGGVGAVVGAATAKKNEVSTTRTIIYSYELVFYLTYLNNPFLKLNLIQHSMDPSHPDYISATYFGQRVSASMRSIVEIANRSRSLSFAMLSNSQMYPGQFLPGAYTPYNQNSNSQAPFPQQYPQNSWNGQH